MYYTCGVALIVFNKFHWITSAKNGIMVFSDCEPINNYTIIGRTKSAMTWSGQYDSVKANLIKKAIKRIPNGTGIIIDTQKGGVDRGVVLTF